MKKLFELLNRLFGAVCFLVLLIILLPLGVALLVQEGWEYFIKGKQEYNDTQFGGW